MKRRSFLKSAAALLPASGLPSLAFGQAAASPNADQIHADRAHLVAAGQDRLGESHSLGFSTILFKVLPSETNGGLFVIEHQHLIHGGPRLHLHLYQDEWFYVMEGEVLFQVGDSQKRLRAGDSILGPRMVPHTFSAAGDTPARMLIAFTPAGKMEQFFRDAGVPNPPAQDAAFFSRYDVRLVGPSPFAS